jgi:integrase/recombinase XerD
VLERLKEYARSRNKLLVSDLTVDLLEDFKAHTLTKFKSTTRAKAVAKLKVFLSEAYRRGWTTEALALKVKSPRAVYEQKLPFTEDDVALILSHAEALNGSMHGYASHGGTFRLLLELMLETGMRVSDAIRYDPRRCKRSEHLWVYTFVPIKQRKNTKPHQAEVFLSDHLKTAIDRTQWLSPALPFAYRPFGTDTIQEWAVYSTMRGIGTRCGVEDCRPHRLRDTFAVRMLVRGVALEDVSQLLGHSSIAVTQKHYAPWVPSRRLRLEGTVREALMDSRGN